MHVCFNDIEREMLSMLKTTQNVRLLGDFNARTGKLKHISFCSRNTMKIPKS